MLNTSSAADFQTFNLSQYGTRAEMLGKCIQKGKTEGSRLRRYRRILGLQVTSSTPSLLSLTKRLLVGLICLVIQHGRHAYCYLNLLGLVVNQQCIGCRFRLYQEHSKIFLFLLNQAAYRRLLAQETADRKLQKKLQPVYVKTNRKYFF